MVGVTSSEIAVETALRPTSRAKRVGLLLIALSVPLYAGVFVVPTLPLEIRTRLILSPASGLVGEATFWVGAAFLGRPRLRAFPRRSRRPSN